MTNIVSNTVTNEPIITSVVYDNKVYRIGMKVAYRGYYITTYGEIIGFGKQLPWGERNAIIRTEGGLEIERSLGSCNVVQAVR